VQLYRHSLSHSSEFWRHNPLCCFSTNAYCCLFRYRLSPETFGYTLVHLVFPFHTLALCARHTDSIDNLLTWLCVWTARETAFRTPRLIAPPLQQRPDICAGIMTHLPCPCCRMGVTSSRRRIPRTFPELWSQKKSPSYGRHANVHQLNPIRINSNVSKRLNDVVSILVSY
jgi:hypothetical protein